MFDGLRIEHRRDVRGLRCVHICQQEQASSCEYKTLTSYGLALVPVLFAHTSALSLMRG